MRYERTIEGIVGIFIVMAVVALLVLAFKVSGLTSFFRPEGYNVIASFNDVGQLKIRAPVKISGVRIGEVTKINLDPSTFKADVTLHINADVEKIPNDSSASILTSGLLGDNYIALTPMYSQQALKDGDVIQDTQPAIILEKLIGQFLFKVGKEEENKNAK